MTNKIIELSGFIENVVKETGVVIVVDVKDKEFICSKVTSLLKVISITLDSFVCSKDRGVSLLMNVSFVKILLWIDKAW